MADTIIIPTDMELAVATFAGVSREDPWNLVKAARLAAWKAQGLKYYGRASEFVTPGTTVSGTAYADQINNLLRAGNPYTAGDTSNEFLLRRLTGQTATLALNNGVGRFGDQPTLESTESDGLVAATGGDLKIAMGLVSATGYGAILPATSDFRIDMGINVKNLYYAKLFGQNDQSKLNATIVGNDVRFTFASSGGGTRSLTCTLPITPRTVDVQLAFIRTGNKARIRYNLRGISGMALAGAIAGQTAHTLVDGWGEVTTTGYLTGDSLIGGTPYSISTDLTFGNATASAGYGLGSYIRYVGAWGGTLTNAITGYPAGVQKDWERHIAYGNAMRPS